MNSKFAAFIMTYERPAVLSNTIAKLLNQTYAPCKILIVDNSLTSTTRRLVAKLNNSRIEYINVGYNSGPAGAASIGLQILTEQGYDWIYWGDDDDPPKKDDTFELMFTSIDSLQKKTPDIRLGIFGQIGGYFNGYTARMRNLYNKELGGIQEVDQIPGNKTMIINSKVVKAGVLPNAKLFFGFEELDFCLRVKKAGYVIMLDGDAWLKSRIELGKVNANYKWKGSHSGRVDLIWRQYYSGRNMLDILFKNKYYIGLLFFLIKLMAKSVYGFKFGSTYGLKNFKVQWLAIRDFLVGKFHKVDLEL